MDEEKNKAETGSENGAEYGQPSIIEQGIELAKQLAQKACDMCFEECGERPHWEVYGNKIFIVWPDGEITNEIDVSVMQHEEAQR
jgi:hypothetical protein